MADIDVSTGLPSLPEGFRWEVAHPTYYVYSFTFTPEEDHTRLELRLQRSKPNIRVEEVGLFRKKSIDRIDGVIWETLYSEEVKGVHPIAVLNAANRIMKKWEVDLRRKSLIGVYPPKRLNIDFREDQ